MKIEKSTVVKLLLTELDRIDPITVMVENFEPGKGKIIIECYGKCWSYYWGGMSGKSLQEFFTTSDTDYLVGKLAPEVNAFVIDDGRALKEVALAQVDILKDSGDIDDDIADTLKSEIYTNLYSVEESQELLYELFGPEWWHSLPEKPNHDYVYLCDIVDIVRAAFMVENNDN